MTAPTLRVLYRRLRARFARRYPTAAQVRLVIHARHYLERPSPRDLAWFDAADRTINVTRALLREPRHTVKGILVHELGHAVDPRLNAPGCERRADAIAQTVTGKPLRYDGRALQSTSVGKVGRPGHLHQ